MRYRLFNLSYFPFVEPFNSIWNVSNPFDLKLFHHAVCSGSLVFRLCLLLPPTDLIYIHFDQNILIGKKPNILSSGPDLVRIFARIQFRSLPNRVAVEG